MLVGRILSVIDATFAVGETAVLHEVGLTLGEGGSYESVLA